MPQKSYWGFFSLKMSFCILERGSVFVAPMFARLFSDEKKKKFSFLKILVSTCFCFDQKKEKKLFLFFSSLETFS